MVSGNIATGIGRSKSTKLGGRRLRHGGVFGCIDLVKCREIQKMELGYGI